MDSLVLLEIFMFLMSLKKYAKTYYVHYNKTAYLQLREEFNENRNILSLYLLLIYGFNHMIRFNSAGEFNLPVDNVDFNQNVYSAICGYLNFLKNNDVTFINMDFVNFLDGRAFDENAYVYCDPPYLISDSGLSIKARLMKFFLNGRKNIFAMTSVAITSALLFNSTNRNYFKLEKICHEAVDEYIRKMRMSGLLSLRGNGRFLDINGFEKDLADYVVQHYSTYPKFTTEETYINYMGTIDGEIVQLEDHSHPDSTDVRKKLCIDMHER